MAYLNTLLNISEKRNLLFKPKARYTSSSEERNSIRSPSPPIQSLVTEPLLYRDPRSPYGLNPLYSGNMPEYFRLPAYPAPDHFPYPCMEGDSTRLSSSVIPYHYDYGSAHLPTVRSPASAVVDGSHYRFHPYICGQMKVPAPFLGYEHLILANFRKPKRVRTAFSPTQLLTLEKSFEKNHYVVGIERKQLAQLLNLSETQVKVWFQNRRTKHKRQQDSESCSQKIDGKDCLDSREASSDEPTTSDDDEEARSPSEISSPFEINEGNSLEKCKNSTPVVNEIQHSTPLVSETENLTPLVSETENLTPLVSETENTTPVVRKTPENPTNAVINRIWNPVSMLEQTVTNERIGA